MMMLSSTSFQKFMMIKKYKILVFIALHSTRSSIPSQKILRSNKSKNSEGAPSLSDARVMFTFLFIFSKMCVSSHSIHINFKQNEFFCSFLYNTWDENPFHHKKKLFVQFLLDYNLFFMQFNMWNFLFMNVFNVNNEKCYDLHTWSLSCISYLGVLNFLKSYPSILNRLNKEKRKFL